MSEAQLSERTLDRLRSSLAAAGIPFIAADIEGIAEKGFLRRLAAFEALVAPLPSDAVPDYLGDRSALLDVAESTGALPAATVLPSVRYQPPPNSSGGHEAGDQRRYAAIADIAGLIRTRQVSPVELAEQSLARIAERDPQLSAFQLVLVERALEAARQAEQEIAAGEYRGPLHGVPVAVKDLLALRGTATTAGSKLLADGVSASDSAAVERLEAAGAVIVGKTRMSEFAYSPGSNNGHYGPTRNPWNLDYDTGGSSSGSAAAVADGMVYSAIGSDTGGSIRIPAAQCGIVGLKPTFGRISLHGAVTLSWSLDHLGPLTRSVADAALMLLALSGYDPRDPRSRAAPPLSLASLDAGVRGLRIGVLREDGSGAALASDEALEAWRLGLAALERNGAELIELDLPEIDQLRLLNSAILALEAVTFHLPMLREHLDDYGPFMRQRILASFAYDGLAFVRAQQARGLIRQRLNGLFDQVDLLSTPTMPAVAPLLGTPGSTNLTCPFNILGWPTITVPVALGSHDLPLGLQLAGRPWDEATVLRAARAVEAG